MTDKILDSILKDNTSGSTELLQKLIDYFLQNPNNITEQLLEDLKINFHPFRTITKFLSELQTNISSKNSKQIIEYLNLYSSNTANQLALLFKNTLPYFVQKRKFITISNSKTLQFVFANYHNFCSNLEITILESRPQYEGRILARALLSNNIKIEMVTEAMAANLVETCDAVIIGADKVLKDGSVINKTGSRNLAILSKYFNKPFYVLSSKNKFTNTKKYERDFHSPQEIWNARPKNIKIENYYFEKIESSLITQIISN